MKKQFKLMALASAAMLFAACSQENLMSPQEQLAQTPENNAIQFGTYMGKAGTTRTVTPISYDKGPIANTAVTADGIKSLAQAHFGVFAYLTTADYEPATPTSQRPDFMYNQELQYDDAKSWIYTPVKYWPNGIDAGNTSGTPSNTAVEKTIQKLSFFAYAPYKAPSFFDASYANATDGAFPSGLADATTKKNSTATNGITAMTTNDFTGNVWVKYALPTATEQEAVDLLWGLNGATTYNEADNSDPTVGTIGGAYNINLTKQAVESSGTQKVQFLFKHALAKIQGSSVSTAKDLDAASSKCGFSVKLDVDGNNGDNQTTFFENGFNKTKTLVTIKSVKIQDGTTASSDSQNGLTSVTSDIYTSGWFNIETGTWDNTGATTGATININVQNNTSLDDAATNVYTLNPMIRENSASPAVKNAAGVDWNPSANSSTDGYTGGAEGVEVTAKPLFANEYVPGLMFIPGHDQTIYVTVDYIVRTADANLSTGYSQVEQVITNKVTLPAASLLSNKIFKIIMHLGLTSVKFEAKVADWQTNAGGTYDNEGNYSSGGDANEQSIWLPSNVIE